MTSRQNIDIVLFLNLFPGLIIIFLRLILSPAPGARVDLARQQEAAADQNICFLSNVALFPTFPTGSDSIQHCQHQGENSYWFGMKNVKFLELSEEIFGSCYNNLICYRQVAYRCINSCWTFLRNQSVGSLAEILWKLLHSFNVEKMCENLGM